MFSALQAVGALTPLAELVDKPQDAIAILASIPLPEPRPVPPKMLPLLLLPNSAQAPSAVPMIPRVRPALALPLMSLLP